MPLRFTSVRHFRQLMLALVAIIALAGCGKSATVTPTSIPPTNVAAAPTTAPTIAAAIAPSASPPVTGPTVGQIADRISAAWGAVHDFRATTTSNTRGAARLDEAASPVALGTPVAASPVATQVGEVTVEDVVMPSARHIVQFSGGQPVAEYIVTDGKIYGRGVALSSGTPVADPNQWRVLDPGTPLPNSEGGNSLSALLQPATAPYSGLSSSERSRDAHPAGTLEIDGRSCDAFRAVDTTNTGERIDIVIALDTSGLPCSIETIVGTTDTITVFEFNTGVAIAAPTT